MPGRITVLQAVPALFAGGVERQTVALAGYLARAGHRSMVLSAGGPLCALLKEDGVEHLTWPIGRKSPASLARVPALARILRREQVDVVLASSRFPAWMVCLARRFMPAAHRPAFLTAVHSYYSVNPYSAIMTRGDRVVTVSRAATDYVKRNYRSTDPTRIREVPLGIDRGAYPRGFRPPAGWTARFRAEHPLLAGRPLVTLPARFAGWKGPDVLLDLLAGLTRKGISVAAAVCGEIPRRQQGAARRLLEKARRGKLPLDLLGHRTDVREVMAASSVVVSLSAPRPEAFGLAVLEALSLGVPVVGWDHGGVGILLREIFPEGAVPPGRYGLLEERVASCLSSSPAVPPFAGYEITTTLEQMEKLFLESADRSRPCR